ncbi:MAG: tRNA uridine-5-carboxymethylaminomethyl(34) synthesis GTPase MnmE [Pseudomonadota bacterium]|nr:tRNA uridine-5-carboxymethylaminomethyl(34) synthesis GTPase MnmE [Pseudomonadota bacterium]
MVGSAGDDTIVALSSGRLPAAIAVIRTSGTKAFAIAEAISGPLGASRRARLRTLRDPRDGSPIDRALLISFAAPDTVTGENIVEYQCHGSKAVVASLIDTLTSFDGVREARPGEFTRRALSNGKIDLTQAEGLAELLEAETEAQRRSALSRSEGALRRQLEQWRKEILGIAADLEVAIDYVDEEDGTATGDVSPRITARAAEMAALLGAPRVEKLRDGVRVVVAGPPNAGKSSLVNALAGHERAIVTPIPGTTRDRIEVPLALGGIPIVLVDTAGLRETDDQIERIGVELAGQEVAAADILLWLGDVDSCPDHPGLIAVASKCDIAVAGRGVAVSAKTGEGVTALKRMIAARAAQLVPLPSQLALSRREADLIDTSRQALVRADAVPDPVFKAEEMRSARLALDEVSGRAGVEALLDTLFERFCLGK